MKVTRLAGFVVAASLGFAFVSQTALAQSKTRAQVNAELSQAQHDGITPVSKTQYPPTPDALARQKQLHAVAWHAGEKSPNFDQHDSVASR
ncbi:DUF4148 domain-containing protein [Paraburkholderia bannensis]|uniref:DUF4148 domain-containing protein n=1 Tax=Paraburkholderia bannensis TaxID=765414 RepID=UPI002AB74161|nr:DUF4148 domain-containing protein [Paraburkholderia bannensis]